LPPKKKPADKPIRTAQNKKKEDLSPRPKNRSGLQKKKRAPSNIRRSPPAIEKGGRVARAENPAGGLAGKKKEGDERAPGLNLTPCADTKGRKKEKKKKGACAAWLKISKVLSYTLKAVKKKVTRGQTRSYLKTKALPPVPPQRKRAETPRVVGKTGCPANPGAVPGREGGRPRSQKARPVQLRKDVPCTRQKRSTPGNGPKRKEKPGFRPQRDRVEVNQEKKERPGEF